MAKRKCLVVQNVTRERPGLTFDVIGEMGFECDRVDFAKEECIPPLDEYDAMIMLGGQDSATNDQNAKIKKGVWILREWLKTEKPFLGICLGMQVLVKAAGGDVVKSSVKEVGFRDHEGHFHEVHLTSDGIKDPIFSGFDPIIEIFHMHEDTVVLGEGMTSLAHGKHVTHQAVKVGKFAYGVQGHFELTKDIFDVWRGEFETLSNMDQDGLVRDFFELEERHTMNGTMLFKNFLSLVKKQTQ